MREKKKYVIMTFAATTAAMAMEKECERRQIPGRLIPLPAVISAGCGLAWRMLPEEYTIFEAEIEKTGICIQQKTEIVL